MRRIDLEQAELLESKIELHARLLREASGAAQNLTEPDGIETFLNNFGSYRELITDNCDTVEISQHVLRVVQEISQLSSNLYKSATGYDLPIRSFSSLGERPGDAYQSPKLPTRAETFGGFDERRLKQQQQQQPPPLQARDPIISSLNNTINVYRDNHHHPHHQEKRDSYSSETDTISLASVGTPLHQSNSQHSGHRLSQQHDANPNLEALQVSHHLHTLLCIINQQMTAIASLQTDAKFGLPKSKYKHNDQLEELRNMQDKLQEDKMAWLKQKEHQERELREMRDEQEALKKQLQEQQIDIAEQRDKVFRQMEQLSKQGIVLSPANVAHAPTIVCSDSSSSHATADDHTDTGGNNGGAGSEKRRDKWRSASSKFMQIIDFILFTIWCPFYFCDISLFARFKPIRCKTNIV